MNEPTVARGPMWKMGRLMLVCAALGIILALLLAQRAIPDAAPEAIRYVENINSAESRFSAKYHRFGTKLEIGLAPPSQYLVGRYVFTIKPKISSYSVIAMPSDPRHKSFYSDDSGIIHSAPGSQAPDSSGPIENKQKY